MNFKEQLRLEINARQNWNVTKNGGLLISYARATKYRNVIAEK